MAGKQCEDTMRRTIKRSVIMQLTRRGWVAMLLSSIITLTNIAAAQAGDYSQVSRTMKPLYAVSFDVGPKHVLSYFLSKSGLCDLTVMVTDKPSQAPQGEEIRPLATSRFKALINSGKTARLDTAEGKAFEYECKSGAQAMSIREVKQVATTSPSAQ